MYVCMCLYVYIYIHIYIHAYVHTYICILSRLVGADEPVVLQIHKDTGHKHPRKSEPSTR